MHFASTHSIRSERQDNSCSRRVSCIDYIFWFFAYGLLTVLAFGYLGMDSAPTELEVIVMFGGTMLHVFVIILVLVLGESLLDSIECSVWWRRALNAVSVVILLAFCADYIVFQWLSVHLLTAFRFVVD